MATLSISLPAQFISQIDTEAKNQGATRSEFFRALLRKYFTNEVQFEVFTPRPLEEIRAGMQKTSKYNTEFIDGVVNGLARSSHYASKPA